MRVLFNKHDAVACGKRLRKSLCDLDACERSTDHDNIFYLSFRDELVRALVYQCGYLLTYEREAVGEEEGEDCFGEMEFIPSHGEILETKRTIIKRK